MLVENDTSKIIVLVNIICNVVNPLGVDWKIEIRFYLLAVFDNIYIRLRIIIVVDINTTFIFKVVFRLQMISTLHP